MLLEHRGKTPQVDPSAYVAPNAIVCGDVRIGPDARVLFGAVLTADEELATTVRSLRSHAMTSGTWDCHTGHEASYDVIDVGYNYRLDEPRAALGLARLPRLRDDIERRRSAVQRYREALAGTPGLTLMWTEGDVARSSHFAFPVLFASGEERARVRAALTEQGVPTELLVLPHGRHGLGLAPDEPAVAGWSRLCEEWLQRGGWAEPREGTPA